MSYRNTIAAIALGLILSSGLAQSQDTEGVTVQPSSQEKQTETQKGNSYDDGGGFSIPVRVIEDPVDAQHARDREASSDKHEADDLEAQRKAADAAERGATASERQIIPTYLQLLIAFVGTTALLYTLILNRQANRNTIRAVKLAEDANKITEDTSRKQLRAYIGLASGGITLDLSKNRGLAIVVMQNYGQTPAHEMLQWLSIEILDVDEVFQEPAKPAPGVFISKSMISPGQNAQVTFGRHFRDGELQAIRDGQKAFFIRGWIEYIDVFETPRKTKLSFKMTGHEGPFVQGQPDTLGWALQPTDYGNEAN